MKGLGGRSGSTIKCYKVSKPSFSWVSMVRLEYSEKGNQLVHRKTEDRRHVTVKRLNP